MVEERGIRTDDVAVEFAQNGTVRSHSCKPGARAIAHTIIPTRSIKAYIILVDVEFLHDGHAEQQREHAVPVQQQAS